MRLKDRVAIVVGAGQSPGEGIGNGRATALIFAREGAKVLCVDHNVASAQETVDMIAAKGGERSLQSRRHQRRRHQGHGGGCARRWGRVDILHNNVGVSLSGGDAELLAITEEAFDRCWRSISRAVSSPPSTSSRSCASSARRHHQHFVHGRDHDLSICRLQGDQIGDDRVHRAARLQNAEYGIRANVILPGLMNTPMAVDTRAREFKKSRAEVEAERDSKVPFRRKWAPAGT